ncbi:MAG TPA: hypothetical protein VNW97_13730 [Candidatus Saccharimonadales bacterium]|jgi:hypothetical protein|nr:hypothetical protein [Candidatus Saccharimonadales bacterium]
MKDIQNAPLSGSPRRQRVWSIGIYSGPSPLALSPAAVNPVLNAGDVTDADALFVADPFLLLHRDIWYMYFEVLLRQSRRGVIGFATSGDGLRWKYERIALDGPFHLSYPQVFGWRDSIYMLPETLGANAVRLYRAAHFPGTFEPVCDLIEGQWADPTVFYDQGLWWMLACSTPYENRTLHLFSAEELQGPWIPHPRNPVVADDQRVARPGGRVRRVDGHLIRFAQDCVPRYGSRLRAIEILELTRASYREAERPESPVLLPSETGWNAVGMHHMDAHQLKSGGWLACVDGDRMLPGSISSVP